ncbi:uncharacterized protein LOC126846488 [Adelges cooleyi]|uniref:uncharacterized protein LOC126846488 n=1 Tax=Adelges cooleyi TaxID=133065 RepID=UPI00218081CF|nr:uncharacterized protein LOC126846488 [Adelges cooleyi]
MFQVIALLLTAISLGVGGMKQDDPVNSNEQFQLEKTKLPLKSISGFSTEYNSQMQLEQPQLLAKPKEDYNYQYNPIGSVPTFSVFNRPINNYGQQSSGPGSFPQSIVPGSYQQSDEQIQSTSFRTRNGDTIIERRVITQEPVNPYGRQVVILRQ